MLKINLKWFCYKSITKKYTVSITMTKQTAQKIVFNKEELFDKVMNFWINYNYIQHHPTYKRSSLYDYLDEWHNEDNKQWE